MGSAPKEKGSAGADFRSALRARALSKKIDENNEAVVAKRLVCVDYAVQQQLEYMHAEGLATNVETVPVSADTGLYSGLARALLSRL